MIKANTPNASHTKTVTHPAFIMLVEDLMTGSMNGTVTKGGLVLVTGHNIKLNSGNGTKDAILFINKEGEVTSINGPLEKNESEQLIFSIPYSLEAGEYIFQIRKSFLNEKEQPSLSTVALTYLLKLEVQIPCMTFINCSPRPIV